MKGLAEYQALTYLKEYGINVVPMKLVADMEEALNFVEEVAYPVVLKGVVRDLYHKSELGIVKININNDEMLKKAWGEIEQSVNKTGMKSEGMLIQKMVHGVEVIVGASYEEQFGPVVMVGIGGIYTEIFRDVAFRLAPVTLDEAYHMLKELRLYKILKGARGQGQLCIDGLLDIVVKVSNLITNEGIKEIDLNPVIVTLQDAIVVDALIIQTANGDGRLCKY